MKSGPVTVVYFLLLGWLAGGCTRLSPGKISDVSAPHLVQAVLVRGYLDWYSSGMDTLAQQLRSSGIASEVFREEQWGELADALVQRPHHPVILVGFSYGADDVILIARRLNDRHLPVDLLITIDPVTPAAVPANVKRCVNFYEPNGFWDIFPWLRGVPLHTQPHAHCENINIRQRPDLDEPDTNHSTIAGNKKVQQQIRSLVQNATVRKNIQ